MRTSRLLIPLVIPAVLLTGCGSDEPDASADSTPTAVTSTPASSPSEEPSMSAEPSIEPEAKGVVLDISIQGDSITPNGKRVEAELGEPIILMIDSDRAGALHVHSTPEQEIAFTAGNSQQELVIKQPGVVEVEDHDAEFVIAQLQVS